MAENPTLDTTATIAALHARVAALEAERDRLDCTRREGGDTRHCRVDAKCLRCRYEALEAAHVSREDREEAIQAAVSSAAAYERGHGYKSYLAEARRLLKLEDA